MTKEQAVGIATAFLLSRPDILSYCRPNAEDAFFLKAESRREMDATAGAWVVHFPRLLDDGVAIQEPDTVGIQIDDTTGEATIVPLL